MYLKRVKPFGDEIFNRSISDFIGTDYTVNQPAANIVELDEKFIISFATPGLEKENFTIKVDKNHLIVGADVKNEVESEDGKFTRREFNYESFKRRFFLPKTVNKDQISAEYNNGILTISLDKKEEAKEKEAIEIAIK
ncbi:Hsp20/alpha crystallin family protein [Portibacter lacus]|uniref:SHSP domain-containing protein n=1 Tax=Portibacter lacus TaxID=1099794 RepID=A0AA37WES3_9BACT|nr:Hsp20/alpha crystallin family protein [Portibacter lacus]GLR18148.1 hypothetical protein GCM10007940_27630 [Portibacter lacus]